MEMESIFSTVLILIGPVALVVASQLWPDWFNARRWTTVGITAAVVLGIVGGSWLWGNHRAADARRTAPVVTIDPAERARMDAGAGLKY